MGKGTYGRKVGRPKKKMTNRGLAKGSVSDAERKMMSRMKKIRRAKR
tara:strand:- start:480 stop:620 length:141 start_codon:yes stop_codon:yes gene_type:complete